VREVEALVRRVCREELGLTPESLASQLGLASVPELIGYLAGRQVERDARKSPWPWWKWFLVAFIPAVCGTFISYLASQAWGLVPGGA
jgi:hypothetical protein